MTFRLDIRDHVATITLDRPEVRNALLVETVDDIGRTVTECEARDDVRVFVLTGADPAFCAGFDLRNMAGENRDVQRARLRPLDERFRAFPEHRKPIIGAINGAAVTGGLELALGCDFMIASERARFADTHGRVGVMPGMGITVRLPQLIGIDRARQMSLTGDFIDATRAYEWGLVTEVVPHEQLLARAYELASHVVSIPERNIAELRAQYDDVTSRLGDDAWQVENARSRAWMAHEFDQARLREVRADIIDRGRSQQ
jgi:enoyl-CoA hydratase